MAHLDYVAGGVVGIPRQVEQVAIQNTSCHANVKGTINQKELQAQDTNWRNEEYYTGSMTSRCRPSKSSLRYQESQPLAPRGPAHAAM